SRMEKPPSASTLFDDDDLRVVRFLTSKRKHQLPAHPTVRDVLLALTAIGGHLKRNGDPGWITIGRGYDDFALAREGVAFGRAQLRSILRTQYATRAKSDLSCQSWHGLRIVSPDLSISRSGASPVLAAADLPGTPGERR